MTRVSTAGPSSGQENQAVAISVIVPVYNGADVLPSCLKSVRNSSFTNFECIVVDDGSADNSAEVALEYGARVISTGRNRGPAHARNVAARVARGEIILFLDADVCISHQGMERIFAAFADDSELTAVIGSYDDSPEAPDFLSRYRNLLHCYTHRHGKRRASTFWSGCGAIRRQAFLEQGGFDETYERPSIEDIELGYRLSRAGKKLILDPEIMVKHLKHWSFGCMVRTDVRDRGIPWTELILRSRNLPNDLNLKISQRASVGLAAALIPAALIALRASGQGFLLPVFAALFLAFASLAASYWHGERMLAAVVTGAAACALAVFHGAYWALPLLVAAPVLLRWRERRGRTEVATKIYAAYSVVFTGLLLWRFGQPPAMAFYGCLAGLIVLNFGFYRFLSSRMGLLESLAAIPFHILFHFYSGVAFGIGILRFMATSKSQNDALDPLATIPIRER